MIGLLPQEEAAINRALHESLLEEKKKTPPKNKEPVSTRTMPEATSTDTQSHTTCSSTSVGAVCTTAVSPEVMELKAHDPVEGSSGTKIPLKRGRLHSPLSPSRSVDSSCESKSSSPTHICVFAGTSSSSVSSPLSVESSLKLVLSTSSWSCSSSSSWSPSPEPVSNNSEKMVQKSSKVQLLPKLKTETVSIVTKQKGKRGRPRKYPLKDTPPKLSKKSKGSDATSKAPKTHTKASASSKKKQHKIKTKLSKPKIWEPKHAAQQLSSELDVPPMSPEAAIVLHDHCYSSGVNISNTVEDDTATSTKCSIRSRYICIHAWNSNQFVCKGSCCACVYDEHANDCASIDLWLHEKYNGVRRSISSWF